MRRQDLSLNRRRFLAWASASFLAAHHDLVAEGLASGSPSGSAQVTALGDEQGLLLVMQRGRVISFDAPEKKAVSVFRTAASVRGVQRVQYRVTGFPYEVSVEK